MDDPQAPTGLNQLPAVRVLRRVWLEQFYAEDPIRWRAATDLPPAALMISSPYDVEARVSVKRDTRWTGYKVQLTETCDDDAPSIITNVTTTPATTTDHEATAGMHARLVERGLLPREHLVDTT